MKKVILGLAFAVLVMVGCSKDDTPAPAPTPTNNKIVGTWKKSASTIQTGVSGTPTNHLNNVCSTSDIIKFTGASAGANNGTVDYTKYNYVSSNCVPTVSTNYITWTDAGGFISINYGASSGGIVQSTATYSNNDATMLFTTNDGLMIIKETYIRQ